MKINKTIRDAVHGDIYFDDDIFLQIIDTPEFQRLRRINQLAGAQFAFPGATHTRFSHSIGVYYVVCEFLKNPYFDKATTDEEKLLVKLAGLLHDIGHGPFSHSFEKITKKSHESYSRELITNPDGNISKILKARNIDPEKVASIIAGTFPNKVINLIVSSQLDADRLDYLARDSYYAGVDYASLETTWLINAITIDNDRIVFPEKTKYAIESFLLGRFHMFKQVYNHKLSISFDVVLVNWYRRLNDLYKQGFKFKNDRLVYFFNELMDGKEIPLNKYKDLDDATMYDLFKLSVEENDAILSDLGDRLLTRRYFEVIPENDANIDEIKADLAKENLDSEYYLSIVTPKDITIYKDGIIEGKDETIYVQTDKGIVSFSQVSELGTMNAPKNKEVVLFPKN